MALTKYCFGDLIELCFIRNSEGLYNEDDTIGVNIDKEIRIMKGDSSRKELKTFWIVKPGFFVYNPRGSRKLGLGYNDTENTYITTFNNMIFKVKESAIDIIHPKYLFIYLSRKEWDRKAEYLSWGSSTEVFTWDTFCETEIDLPPLSVQQKYVDIYNSMLANQRCYERGLEDLKLSFDALLDKFKHSSPKRSVGELLEEVDFRNSDNTFTEVSGVNITKQFMPSVASSSDLHNYKIVSKNQFVYSGMQTGRDECIRIALLDKDEPVIVSPAYSVLKVRSNDIVPEFVQMWFSRSEMDRLGWFMSDSSIRSNLDLPRFYEIKIPVPTKEEQESIVNIYSAYTIRRSINERLKAQIKDLCPILVKGAVEEGAK